MLRLVLLVLYLAAWFPASPHTKIGGGWDPNGLNAPPPPPPVTTEGIGGGLDPNGGR
jgi:hypothetical protein